MAIRTRRVQTALKALQEKQLVREDKFLKNEGERDCPKKKQGNREDKPFFSAS